MCTCMLVKHEDLILENVFGPSLEMNVCLYFSMQIEFYNVVKLMAEIRTPIPIHQYTLNVFNKKLIHHHPITIHYWNCICSLPYCDRSECCSEQKQQPYLHWNIYIDKNYNSHTDTRRISMKSPIHIYKEIGGVVHVYIFT